MSNSYHAANYQKQPLQHSSNQSTHNILVCILLSNSQNTLYMYIKTRNAHAHILPRAGHGRVYVRTYHLQTIPVYACVQAYTYTWNSTYACMHVYTYTCNISPLVEKRSRKLRDDQKFAFSVHVANAINRVSHAHSARVLYCIRASAYTSKRLRLRRLRLLVPACADDRTYVHTYINPENRSRFILPRANALGSNGDIIIYYTCTCIMCFDHHRHWGE